MPTKNVGMPPVGLRIGPCGAYHRGHTIPGEQVELMSHLMIEDKNDVVVVSFNQARIIDDATIRQIGAEMMKLPLEAAAARKLLLRFDRVEFMSSAMIGQILRLSKACQNDKIKLKLCGIVPNVKEVFTLMNLHKVLDICGSEAEALQSFDGSGLGGWFRRG